MIENQKPGGHDPARVVIMGAGGFIGRHLVGALADAGTPCKAITSNDVDLISPDAANRLAEILHEDDTFVFMSALTPDKGRGIEPFMSNMRMAENVASALAKRPVTHVIYTSSDAVYPLSISADDTTSEASAASPGDLYGAMHLARELMMRDVAGDRFLVVRPTIVFGHGDTHNSYGPNRLRRMARDGGEIKLFGQGEETRDHIWVMDLVRLYVELIRNRSVGLLNAATGRSIDYWDLATMTAAQFDNSVTVTGQPRNNTITYRRFNIGAITSALPSFRFTPLEDALAEVHRELMAEPAAS